MGNINSNQITPEIFVGHGGLQKQSGEPPLVKFQNNPQENNVNVWNVNVNMPMEVTQSPPLVQCSPFHHAQATAQAMAGGGGDNPSAVQEPPPAETPPHPQLIAAAGALLGHLECLVCLNLVTKPKICARGHLCCGGCVVRKLKRCPLCKTAFQERVPYVVLHAADLLLNKYEALAALAERSS